MTRWLSVISTPPVLSMLPLATGDPPTDFCRDTKTFLTRVLTILYNDSGIYIWITTPTRLANPTKFFLVFFLQMCLLCVIQISWMTNSQLLSVLLWTFKESWANVNLMIIAMGSNICWSGPFIDFNTLNVVSFPNYQISTLLYIDWLIDVCINNWTIQFKF